MTMLPSEKVLRMSKPDKRMFMLAIDAQIIALECEMAACANLAHFQTEGSSHASRAAVLGGTLDRLQVYREALNHQEPSTPLPPALLSS